jgi:hypothetical protein
MALFAENEYKGVEVEEAPEVLVLSDETIIELGAIGLTLETQTVSLEVAPESVTPEPKPESERQVIEAPQPKPASEHIVVEHFN